MDVGSSCHAVPQRATIIVAPVTGAVFTNRQFPLGLDEARCANGGDAPADTGRPAQPGQRITPCVRPDTKPGRDFTIPGTICLRTAYERSDHASRGHPIGPRAGEPAVHCGPPRRPASAAISRWNGRPQLGYRWLMSIGEKPSYRHGVRQETIPYRLWWLCVCGSD